MEAEEISEEEMIDSLFFRCDVQGEGKVEIGTIIQFLENSLGNGHVSILKSHIQNLQYILYMLFSSCLTSVPFSF